MFGLFASQKGKMRDNASNWLDEATRVWNYRQDRLSEEEGSELRRRREQLKALLREKADDARLKVGIEALEAVLARTGGAVYPRSSLVENVEFFLVAAIVILGIRSYFVQPFTIPTNSMWPTYWGMKAENFPPSGPAPGPAARVLRFLALGARGYILAAPASGEVTVPFFAGGGGRSLTVAYTKRSGRSWLVFPSKVREYTFYVGDQPATLQVPEDFGDMDEIVLHTFFSDQAALMAQVRMAAAQGRITQGTQKLDEAQVGAYPVYRVPLGRKVAAGAPIVRFDITTGDKLMVDRLTYNFVRPKVGQGFVFRTENIPGLNHDDYLIKRLVGRPGDRIEIRDPVLWRNGEPITGAKAFDLNGHQVPPYQGYRQPTRDDPQFTQLFPGEVVTVPDFKYLALGDNSHNSLDGRYWGFVPEKDVIGHPLFIYYPFTGRWGAAH